MKAKVLATGKIIDADRLPCKPDLFYGDGHVYSEADLEFLPDTPEEVTIEGWVTRSKNGKIVFSDSQECKRGGCVWYHKEGSNIVILSETGLFDEGILPSVTWESEPQKVKITITPMEDDT